MKRKALAIASVVVLSMAVASVSARAQASFPLAANIPFDFVVGKQTLPAGEYRIEQLSSQSVQLIRSTDGHTSTIVMTMAALANDWQSESKLVFNRYGDQYFLSQIWTAGNKSGRELYKSPRETELAGKAVKREVAVLAARSSARP
jgi:hypothetical protein